MKLNHRKIRRGIHTLYHGSLIPVAAASGVAMAVSFAGLSKTALYSFTAEGRGYAKAERFYREDLTRALDDVSTESEARKLLDKTMAGCDPVTTFSAKADCYVRLNIIGSLMESMRREGESSRPAEDLRKEAMDNLDSYLGDVKSVTEGDFQENSEVISDRLESMMKYLRFEHKLGGRSL